MKVQRIKYSVYKSISVYKKLLDEIADEQFQTVPPDGGWSYAQVYSHILYVNQLSLISIERCVNHTANQDSSRLDWRVWLILLFGKLPPGKIKAPGRIASRVNQITKEDARNGFMKFSERFEHLASQISKAAPDQKISHPRLGPLNGPQWFRFVDIHTRHHIAQLYRIKSALKK